jgi:F-type H+-transporting ATPase subunit delta
MAGDATTLARPYAEAIFDQAEQTKQLGLWSNMLDSLAMLLADEALQAVLTNPSVLSSQKAELILSIVGDNLSQEGKNLVRLLAENTRLALIPEILSLFKQYQATAQGTLEVDVETAYALEAEQQTQLATALQARLGRKVILQSRIETSLIGGFRIRAGDLVIDGSVAGQLDQLSQSLGAA